MEGINQKFVPGMGPLTKKVELKRDRKEKDKNKKDEKSESILSRQTFQVIAYDLFDLSLLLRCV